MLVIVGLIVLLVAVTIAITILISARATHDSFAVLSDRVGGHVVRDRGRSDGVSRAERISVWRAASATPGVARLR